MSKDEAKSKISSRESMELFVNFHAAYKLARIYEPNNVQFQDRIHQLFTTLDKVLGNGEAVQIRIIQDSIFLNQTRLKFDFSNFLVYRFILEEFQNAGIGTIDFKPGLQVEELQAFIILFSKKRPLEEHPFEQLAEDMRAVSFLHIRLEKIPAAHEIKLADRNTVPMYFLGIYHLKEIFDARAGALNLQITKRWIQSITNLLAFDESVLFGLTTIKNFEDYTLNHSVNVCVLALSLGRRLGLERPELIELGIGSCLHDIGKFEIPGEIVDKPGRLIAEERAVMEMHAPRGASVLIQTRTSQDVPVAAFVIAMEHHLTPSLGGYPKFAWRRETSLFSKIVKVVDYYDAVTTKRVYRPKTFTPEEAIRLMVEQGEKEFDPLILKAFINMIGIYPIGSLVILDSGEIGVVIQPNPNAALVKRPKVKLITDARGNKFDGGIADLAETDGTEAGFKRSIIMSLDPNKYDLHVYDYLLAKPQTPSSANPASRDEPSARHLPVA